MPTHCDSSRQWWSSPPFVTRYFASSCNDWLEMPGFYKLNRKISIMPFDSHGLSKALNKFDAPFTSSVNLHLGRCSMPYYGNIWLGWTNLPVVYDEMAYSRRGLGVVVDIINICCNFGLLRKVLLLLTPVRTRSNNVSEVEWKCPCRNAKRKSLEFPKIS